MELATNQHGKQARESLKEAIISGKCEKENNLRSNLQSTTRDCHKANHSPFAISNGTVENEVNYSILKCNSLRDNRLAVYENDNRLDTNKIRISDDGDLCRNTENDYDIYFQGETKNRRMDQVRN